MSNQNRLLLLVVGHGHHADNIALSHGLYRPTIGNRSRTCNYVTPDCGGGTCDWRYVPGMNDVSFKRGAKGGLPRAVTIGTESSAHDFPVTGGKPATKDLYDRVVRKIAREAGHPRSGVLGLCSPSHQLESRASRNCYLDQIHAYFRHEKVCARLHSAGITRLVLLDDAAAGSKPWAGSVCAWSGAPKGDPSNDAQLVNLISRGIGNAIVLVELTCEVWAGARHTFECFPAEEMGR